MIHRFFSSAAKHFCRPQSTKTIQDVQDITAQQLRHLKLDPKFAKIFASMEAQLQINKEIGSFIPSESLSNALDKQEESFKHSFYS